MQIFRDNRIDQEYTLPDSEIREKFLDWQDGNPDLRDNWPHARQVGAFLMTLGTIDASDYQKFNELAGGIS